LRLNLKTIMFLNFMNNARVVVTVIR